ncbi:hypothetical protein LNQ03_02770 [Klebsiella pneumoniae subsp. pneumoniae]|nr:hypothetical protein [Klebsiella pneumoniae subsp. pneumoniae]
MDEVWGVGRRISKKLEAMGINTVLQLADTDIRFIRKHFNVVLERTVRELRGEPCLGLEEFAPVKTGNSLQPLVRRPKLRNTMK